MTRQITEESYKKLINRVRILVISALIIGSAIGYIFGYIAGVNEKSASAQPAPFDHSNCQYPERWSNPTDGCDNSDPAVPECIKGITTQEAEQACIAAVVKKYEQAAPTVQPVATPPAVTEQPTYQCGVK